MGPQIGHQLESMSFLLLFCIYLCGGYLRNKAILIENFFLFVVSNSFSLSDESDESKYVTIKSPMVGTFYRTPAPEKPQFVNVGDEVEPGKVICIIEAMKLFNEVEADIKGKIVKVLVDDLSPVEYDQPLFLVDPS